MGKFDNECKKCGKPTGGRHDGSCNVCTKELIDQEQEDWAAIDVLQSEGHTFYCAASMVYARRECIYKMSSERLPPC